MSLNEKAFFKVVGMHCITFKSIIEKQLKDENGAKKIVIDYITDSIVIEFDPLLITKEQIKDKMEKSEYKFVRVTP